MRLCVSQLLLCWLSLCFTLVKPQDSDPRVSKFHSLAAKHSGVVLLTSSLYDELLSPTTPRNYSASVILTALDPKYGCVPCRQFDKEHKDVARQWWSRNKRNKNEQSRHFFAVLDFEAGQDVFRRVSPICCRGTSAS